jgi:hypothetical protein
LNNPHKSACKPIQTALNGDLSERHDANAIAALALDFQDMAILLDVDGTTLDLARQHRSKSMCRRHYGRPRRGCGSAAMARWRS